MNEDVSGVELLVDDLMLMQFGQDCGDLDGQLEEGVKINLGPGQ